MSRNKQKIPTNYLPVFCRELYQMVRSGIPVSEGLSLLREDETDKDVLSWLDSLCESTNEGMPLGDALKKTGVFPEYMTDMIDLAENTGRLEDVLLSLQHHYERQNRMRSDIVGAFTVPVVLLVVMIAVVILLITQVLPIFDRVFAQLGVKMGGFAAGMMNVGSGLAKAGTIIAAVVGIFAIAVIIVAAVPALRNGFSKWFKKNFGGKGVLGKMAVSRFASSMAMATSSGMNMQDSVELAAKLCGGSKEIDSKTAKCLTEIEEGGSPADALAASDLFSSRDCRLLKLAERTGNLPETLDDLAKRQEEESLRSIDKLIGTVEPAIVVITSALAGIILISVMLPLMGLLQSIG